MTPQEIQLLQETILRVDDLTSRFNQFLDTYHRQDYIDKFVLTKPLIIRGTNIRIEGTNGMKIGENTTDKVGFLGKTPVARQSAITAPSGGATVDSQARTAISTLITVLQIFGLTA